jgi:hypothetical protein
MYHRRLCEVTSTFTENLSWKEADTWMRQTRISYDASREAATPTSLQKSGDVIDIGEPSLNASSNTWTDMLHRALERLEAHTRDQ